jgi:hypothetical protein
MTPRGLDQFDAMADGVLDERLKNQRGNQRVGDVGRGLHRDRKPVAEPDLFDVEVAPEQIELVAQRHLVGVGVIEAGAEEGRSSG